MNLNLNLNKIPSNPGVYIMKDFQEKIIYIGKAKNLKKRILQYFSAQALKTWKTSQLRNIIKKIDYLVCLNEKEALILERELIHKYQPFFNTIFKDSKTYPFIKITKEDFPRLEITRKKDNKGFYFGPYPKVELIKNLLSFLNSIGLINLRKCKFDFNEKNPLNIKKRNSCLYYHTLQCPAPCDNNRISKKEYLKLVKITKDILNSKYQKLNSFFYNEMKKLSKNLEYEKALKYKNLIKALNHLQEKINITETNLELLNLQKNNIFLNLKEILNLKKEPLHIEAFDNSGLFGRFTVGASVCFINGEKNPSHYRKYLIKSENPLTGSDDFLMMEEIVSRRLKQIKEKGENPPDLFLIDGGKGQLSSALKAIRLSGLDIEVIALAKKFEEIVSPYKNETIKLNRNTPEILMLMKIRDEVHRFAITYHRKLRDKGLSLL